MDLLIDEIFPYLTTKEVCEAMVVCKEWRELVARVRWNDAETEVYDVAGWRECFPRARGVRVRECTDAEVEHLKGIHTLNMEGYPLITDAGLAHLAGIHTLDISHCHRVTDAGLAHLSGIHTLKMSYCGLITDAGLAHLAGIHTLNISWGGQITDAGLALLGCKCIKR